MTKDTKQFNLGWLLVLIFSLVPVFLWFLAPSFVPHFSNFTTSFSNIGQLLGLVGAAMFAINLMLSTRLKFIEKMFFGLNKVYYRHSHLGQIAFVLLIFHPLMLIPKYAGNSFNEAARFLLLGNDWAINWGWLALVGMILLIVFTLYLPIKYNFWKWTHKFFGLFFFLASLHIWFIPSDVSRYLPLRLYMLVLSFIGLSSYFYYTLFGKFFVKKLNYLIKSVNPMGSDIVNIIMEPLKEKLQFKAGQFIFISFEDKKVSGESHPFSITSSPDEKNLSITVKKLGDYTKKIDTLSVGAIAKVEGPYGVFSKGMARIKKQIWVAGGIGVTPFVSMVKSLKQNDGYDVDLYYCLKNESEAVYLNELRRVSFSLNAHLKIIPFYSDSQGRISAETIGKQSFPLNGKDIFICAPPLMVNSLKAQLLAKGINKRLIHSEEFNF